MDKGLWSALLAVLPALANEREYQDIGKYGSDEYRCAQDLRRATDNALLLVSDAIMDVQRQVGEIQATVAVMREALDISDENPFGHGLLPAYSTLEKLELVVDRMGEEREGVVA